MHHDETTANEGLRKWFGEVIGFWVFKCGKELFPCDISTIARSEDSCVQKRNVSSHIMRLTSIHGWPVCSMQDTVHGSRFRLVDEMREDIVLELGQLRRGSL